MKEFEKSFIYNTIPNAPQAHCSFITQIKNGDLLCSWFAGQHEKAKDVKIYMSRMKKENLNIGDTIEWSEPEVIANIVDHSMGSPVFYETPSGKLVLFFLTMHHGKIIGAGWSVCQIKYQISEDNGYTWGDWKFLRKNWFMVTRSRPIINHKKHLLLPIHRELGTYQSMFYHNSDLELTGKWKIIGKISSRETGLLEPVVVKGKNNQLICLMRSSKIHKIFKSISKDGGYNWSRPVETELPNPNSQIDAINLKSEKILLAFNNQEQGRSNLSLAFSEDYCETWKNIKTVFEDGIRQYHYPMMVQDKNNNIHISYTDNRERIGYARFNEEYILR